MSVRESWGRIVAWAGAAMPAAAFTPAGGATDRQLADLEAHLGFALPEDVRESYRLHDGTAGSGFPFGTFLLSLEQVRAAHDLQRQMLAAAQATPYPPTPELVRGPIKPEWWSPHRVPVADTGGGDGLLIDLDPAAGGAVGQVIYHDHEDGPRRVLAPSWAALLEQIAADCAAGAYFYDEDEEQSWARRDGEGGHAPRTGA